MMEREGVRARLGLTVGCAVVASIVLVGTAYAGSVRDRATGRAPGSAVQAAAGPDALAATADTYVVQEVPDQAYGGAAKVAASNWTTWHSEAYLRFDVPAPPAGASTVEARIDLAFQRLDRQPTRLELYSVAGPWSEATTHASRPALGARVATATVPAQGTQTLSFDVTAVVRAGGTYAFAIKNPVSQSAAVFHSREHGTDGPRLTVRHSAASQTLCGASWQAELPGETYQQAYQRLDAAYGGLDLTRVFYGGLPDNWPGKVNTSGRPMNISFKAAPRAVLAGTHDAYLRAWFRAAPRDRDIYWTYYHEPEDNVAAGEFTAADYRPAWQRLSRLADEAGNPRLRATLILMGWSLDARSGRNWRDYYPGRDAIDVLGWDNYNDAARRGVYGSPESIFGDIVATSRGEGLPFAIAETGSGIVGGDTGAGRAAWLRSIVNYLRAAGALYVSYFDIDWRPHGTFDYRLRDAASVAAWREFCS
jgi:hypothetical protein